MAGKKAIDEWALDYWLLQRYARLCFKIFYRKIELVNLHKIPAKKPVILAPNHQNALMDAMVLVCNTDYQHVFLARADIFKGKRLARFLHFLNIMPVYRMRDGIENVKKNDEVFLKTTQMLNRCNNPLILFPEGNHGDRRRLRPLVKGLFRIALLAQEEFGKTPAVVIIPVGIDYGHYKNFRTTLFVNVGDPISISEYYGEYAGNPVNAINRLKEDYAEALGKQMIDIQTEEFYELYMSLREIFNSEMRQVTGLTEKSLEAAFKADKIMIDCLNHELDNNPERIRSLNNLVLPYQSDLRKAGLRDWILRKDHVSVPGIVFSGLMKLLLLPVFIFGFLNNILPFLFISSKAKNVKDPQFHSSFKYVMSMIGFPVWYIVIAGILAFLSLPLWVIVLYVFLLPLTGIAAFEYFIRLRKLLGKLRYALGKNTEEILKLRNTRTDIISTMHEIIKQHKK